MTPWSNDGRGGSAVRPVVKTNYWLRAEKLIDGTPLDDDTEAVD